jgi:hypothetical protein
MRWQYTILAAERRFLPVVVPRFCRQAFQAGPFLLSRLEPGFWLLSVVEVIVGVEPRFLQPTA